MYVLFEHNLERNIIRVFSLNRGVIESFTYTATYMKSSGNKIYILPQTPAKQHSSGKRLSKGFEPVSIGFSFYFQTHDGLRLSLLRGLGFVSFGVIWPFTSGAGHPARFFVPSVSVSEDRLPKSLATPTVGLLNVGVPRCARLVGVCCSTSPSGIIMLRFLHSLYQQIYRAPTHGPFTFNANLFTFS